MGAKIIKFPVKRKPTNNTKVKKASLIRESENKVKRIDEITREEERANQSFPPNYLMLIA